MSSQPRFLALLPLVPLLLLLLPGSLPSFALPGTPSAFVLSGANSSAPSSSTPAITCPVGTDISLGPVTLNCFQSLDLSEVGAILIGVAIAVYIYWDSDKAELPGDSSEVPVTAEEEKEMYEKRKESP